MEEGKSARIVQKILGATVETFSPGFYIPLLYVHTLSVGRWTKCVLDGSLCSERKYDLLSLYSLQERLFELALMKDRFLK
jgi:hypothetical protein